MYSDDRRFVMFLLGLATIGTIIDGLRFGWLT